MAGFGKMKEAGATVEEKASTDDPFAELREELKDVNANRPKTHIFMAVVGKENTGKSAIVFDFYQRYCDKHGKGGRQTTLLEFNEEDEENE